MIKNPLPFSLAVAAFCLCAPQSHAQTATTDAPPAPVVGLMGQEGLNATAWVQSAAEAKIADLQVYRVAKRQLDAALRDRGWSAAVEQAPNFKKLPPAVILDLDETVLDNSAYNARLVRTDTTYTSAGWQSWVSQAAAPAIPGAVEFLNYAAKKGVQIFYISNRTAVEEAATRANLTRLGIPIQGPTDHVLLYGEKPEWTSDKTSRRALVAQNHRVLMLVGDDLNDFAPAKPKTLQQRLDLMRQYDAFWGERWMLISNPLYGSWEGALFDYKNDLSRQEMLKRKYDALQTLEPSAPPVAPTGS